MSLILFLSVLDSLLASLLFFKHAKPTPDSGFCLLLPLSGIFPPGIHKVSSLASARAHISSPLFREACCGHLWKVARLFHHFPALHLDFLMGLIPTLKSYWVSCFGFGFPFLFTAAPAAYGSSQARGQIGAEAASLHHGHSNEGSKPHLQPTLQLSATPDP